MKDTDYQLISELDELETELELMRGESDDLLARIDQLILACTKQGLIDRAHGEEIAALRALIGA